MKNSYKLLYEPNSIILHTYNNKSYNENKISLEVILKKQKNSLNLKVHNPSTMKYRFLLFKKQIKIKE